MDKRTWVQGNKKHLQPYKEYLEQLLQGIVYTNIELPDGNMSMLEKGKGQLLKQLINELEITKGV